MLIPVEPADAFNHRWPRVGLAILTVCVAATAVVSGLAGRWDEAVAEHRGELALYVLTRPHAPRLAESPPAPLPVAGWVRGAQQVIGAGVPRPVAGPDASAQRAELSALARAAIEAAALHPFSRTGFVPARPRPLPLVTSPFVQPSWLWLLATLFVALALASALEEAWGAGPFFALWLAAGAAACGVHYALDADSTRPLVGASGAIAGLLGAFVVRFPRLRVRWAWLGLPALGTVSAPAWSVPLAWVGAQLLAAWLQGPAYFSPWALLAAFVLGAVWASVVVGTGQDLALGADGSDLDLDPAARRHFRAAIKARRSGDLAGARDELLRADRLDPRSPPVAAMMWQLIVEEGDAGSGETFAGRVIHDSLAVGRVDEALERWHELKAVFGHSGSPAIRWRLAQAARLTDSAAAVELLRDLAVDDHAGAMRERAINALESMSPAVDTPPRGILVGAREAEAMAADKAHQPAEAVHADPPPPPRWRAPPPPAPPPAADVLAPLEHGTSGPKRIRLLDEASGDDEAWLGEVTVAGVGASPPPPVHEPAVEPYAPTAPVTGLHRPMSRAARGLMVRRATLKRLEPAAIGLGDGTRLEIRRIEAVSVAVVEAGLGPVVVLDLVVNWRMKHGSEPLKVLRFDGVTSDVREPLGRTDVNAETAFVLLARRLATQAAARLLPESLARNEPGDPLPRFDDVEDYEESLLNVP